MLLCDTTALWRAKWLLYYINMCTEYVALCTEHCESISQQSTCILTQFPSHRCWDTAECCSRTGKRRWRRRERSWTNCHFCNITTSSTVLSTMHPQKDIGPQWLTWHATFLATSWLCQVVHWFDTFHGNRVVSGDSYAVVTCEIK